MTAVDAQPDPLSNAHPDDDWGFSESVRVPHVRRSLAQGEEAAQEAGAMSLERWLRVRKAQGRGAPAAVQVLLTPGPQERDDPEGGGQSKRKEKLARIATNILTWARVKVSQPKEDPDGRRSPRARSRRPSLGSEDRFSKTGFQAESFSTPHSPIPEVSESNS